MSRWQTPNRLPRAEYPREIIWQSGAETDTIHGEAAPSRSLVVGLGPEPC